MKLSSREMILLIATVFTVLYGGTLILAKDFVDEIRETMAQQEQIEVDIQKFRMVVDRKATTKQKLDKMSRLLPPATSENMAVHWQQVLERVAKKNEINIVYSKAGKEEKIGDVYEMPIECRTWEGKLDGVVRFLFDLQAEGAMLDVRKFMVRPKQSDVLKGSFLLYCAYTRTEKKESVKETK